MDVAICPTWSDHRWNEPRFLETGKHPTMGHFHRYIATCDFCKRTTTETRWVDLTRAAHGGYGTTIGETTERREQ